MQQWLLQNALLQSQHLQQALRIKKATYHIYDYAHKPVELHLWAIHGVIIAIKAENLLIGHSAVLPG